MTVRKFLRKEVDQLRGLKASADWRRPIPQSESGLQHFRMTATTIKTSVLSSAFSAVFWPSNISVISERSHLYTRDRRRGMGSRWTNFIDPSGWILTPQTRAEWPDAGIMMMGWKAGSRFKGCALVRIMRGGVCSNDRDRVEIAAFKNVATGPWGLKGLKGG